MAKFSKEVVIDRSLEEIYDFLISEDNFRLVPGIDEVEKDKDEEMFNITGREKIPFVGLESVCYEIHIDETKRPSSIKFHTVDFMTPTQGSWKLSKTERGTKVKYDVGYNVPGSFLGKAIDKLMVEKNAAKEVDEYISSLKQCLEKVEKIMTKEIVTVNSSDKASDVTVKMEGTNIRYFPVLKEGKLVGVVTDGDILSKMYAYGSSSENYPIEKLMTTDVKTVRVDTSVLEVIKLLRKHKIRRIPVVNENDMLVGIVSATDLEAHFGILTKNNRKK
ncbi:CBS domain-containing protein [Candidatus Oleimmundimicrobium sp.]|uniref:CBS domain-containing protein n=1 Tax=Candidatus Oleimmundimicrobium sp. TaxID=3060597 RepID=UPI002721C430|nr:CBS domain-containing protein [Candidatus Oleimmundimicrobium sp.]MDO8886859.1 CBS domain-containing protein [Candidatus Oleimmundimicrobium sp.]